jgi:hypothetical protein
VNLSSHLSTWNIHMISKFFKVLCIVLSCSIVLGGTATNDRGWQPFTFAKKNRALLVVLSLLGGAIVYKLLKRKHKGDGYDWSDVQRQKRLRKEREEREREEERKKKEERDDWWQKFYADTAEREERERQEREERLKGYTQQQQLDYFNTLPLEIKAYIISYLESAKDEI